MQEDYPLAQDYRQGWLELFRANLNELFELALLLTADPLRAEAGVTRSIESLDVFAQPDIKILKKTVALHSTSEGSVRSTLGTSHARSMLRQGLWPVLQVARSPRACFVLKVLMGYGTSACAGMLGIEQHAISTLLRMAILRLNSAVIASELGGQLPYKSLQSEDLS